MPACWFLLSVDFCSNASARGGACAAEHVELQLRLASHRSDRDAFSHADNSVERDGEKIYARILTKFNGTSVHADYTYTATKQAALTSPKPDSKLTGPSVTFAWTAAAGATGYELWLGSKGVGSSNLYNSGSKTTTSLKVGGLPTNGEKIYARIFTNYGETLVHADYEYKAH